MRILITGASGQIGCNLALRCLAAGHAVHGVDLRPNGWSDAYPVLLHDLTLPGTPAVLATQLADWGRPDVVVHLAAHAKVHQLVLQPDKAMENMAMTQQVLEFCRQQGLPIVFSSSREVYGNARRDTTAEADADFALAASTYAASKLAGEALVYSYARCYGLPYLVFRLSNVYGRYDNDLGRMERVIPLFMHKLQQGEALTLFGADKVLDFTYVDDCVAGLFLGIQALQAGEVRDQTFNLARGEGHSLRQLADYLAGLLGRAAQVLEAPTQAGEISCYVANLDKARQLLGYAPQVSLPEGLRRSLAWSCSWAEVHG